MAKTPSSEDAVTQTDNVITDFPSSIDEFCIRLSATEKRVELVGAFNHSERVAGRVLALDSEWMARFDAFVHQPA